MNNFFCIYNGFGRKIIYKRICQTVLYGFLSNLSEMFNMQNRNPNKYFSSGIIGIKQKVNLKNAVINSSFYAEGLFMAQAKQA